MILHKSCVQRRVIGYKRGEDGIECIALYEDVPFKKDQYIPTASAVVNTVVIATC